MGEIVIKIPNNKNRRYVVADSAGADKIIEVLEQSAVRIRNKTAKPSRRQIEDLRDGEAAQRNLDEMRRTGISHSVSELREEFGIS